MRDERERERERERKKENGRQGPIGKDQLAPLTTGA